MNRTILVLVLLIQLFSDFSVSKNYTNLKLRIALKAKFQAKPLKQVDGVCNIANCKEIVADLKDYMNFNANPCENFYDYVCAKFIRNTRLKEGQHAHGADSMIQDKFNENIKDLLEAQPTNHSFDRQLRIFFKSCMDTQNVIGASTTHLMRLIDLFGGYPMLAGNNWDASRYNLSDVLARMFSHGIEGLFKLELATEPVTNFQYLMLSPPDLTLDPEEYINPSPDTISTLLQYMTDMASSFDTQNTMGEFINIDTREMKDFEIRLAECILSSQEHGLYKLQLIRVKEMFKNVFDMTALLKRVFGEVGVAIGVYKPMYTYYMNYLNCLPTVLEETPLKTIGNFLIWNMIKSLSDGLPDQIYRIKHQFLMDIGKSSTLPSRWDICYSNIKDYVAEPLLAMYVKKHFKPANRKRVDNIIRFLKKSIKDILSENTWHWFRTKGKAKDKIKHMDQYIAYPSYFDQPELLNQVFTATTFQRNNYVKNLFEAKKIKMTKHLNGYGKRFTVKSHENPAVYRTVYLNIYKNGLVVPIASLEKPYYSETYPMYLNFGAIGSHIAHEIIHTIDRYGHYHNNHGAFDDWWTQEDKNKYNDKAECFITQYDAFRIGVLNKNVNGTLTVGENVAESEGLRASFRAYKEWLKINGREPKLSNFNYTNEQMFFLGYARTLCEKASMLKLSTDLDISYSAPNPFRVIGTLQNMVEFSEAFNCGEDSMMNPPDKCVLW